ncbi:MAG: VOC family protein [Pseudomonadales bacterium]|nr:VOC family protein [Pseudomonadales bacterium]
MRLNHVTLIVTDLEVSMSFYRALGLKPIVLEEPRYVRFTLPSGDETLSLEVTGEQRGESRVQFYFECPDLDALCADLKREGIEFEQEPTDMDYLWREARIRDPDGHQIRFYYAKDNRLNPPWRIKE